MFFNDVICIDQSIMATPTTLNIGEPADERSVDGNTVPCRDFSPEQGDQEPVYGDMKNEGLDTFDDAFAAGRPHMDIGSMAYEDDEDLDDKKKFCSGIFPECQIKTSDVCFKITPAVGAVSYGYFSLSVVEPMWFSSAFGDISKIVGNTLWFQAHLGAGLYIYSHKHIRSLPVVRGVIYSMFGSAFFNFGSCMFWGLGRSMLPSSTMLRVAFGLISSCVFLYVGQDYLQYVDNKTTELD